MRLLSVVLLLSAAVCTYAEPAAFPETSASWLKMLGSQLDENLCAVGPEYLELNPEDYNSSAGRIIYYPEGLTIWSDYGRIVQLRLDKNWAGRIGRLRIGLSSAELKQIMGEPWIEDELSLYYNLPWNGGPVRLRFVFTDSVLNEIYLYNVR